ncbi:HSP20-like chaperone [Xylariales sp. PMI_506]|nr:HSP20-like chaperone [Xylariales sp. PMI_506]
MAAFFRPQFYSAPEPNFQGLFRLIDDFDKYSSLANGHGHRQNRCAPSFTPKFDLKETETTYELHGELPGVQKDDLHIEFTDPQTLLIRGKVERTYTAGTPPAGLIESKPEVEEPAAAADSESEEPVIVDHASHHATVEDDPEETGSTTSTTAAEAQPTPATTVADVAKPTAEQHQQQKPAAPKHRYYLVERNIGQFSRSFAFPGRVDHEAVKASLNNGILTVIVDKAKKHESRRIAVY